MKTITYCLTVRRKYNKRKGKREPESTVLAIERYEDSKRRENNEDSRRTRKRRTKIAGEYFRGCEIRHRTGVVKSIHVGFPRESGVRTVGSEWWSSFVGMWRWWLWTCCGRWIGT